MTTSPIERPRMTAALAAELRAEMGRRNVSQRQIALRLGRPPLWLSRRVGRTATTDITLDEAAEIADALGADVEGIVVAALRACRDSNPKPSVSEFRRLRVVARIPAGDLPHDVPRPAPGSERHLRAVS